MAVCRELFVDGFGSDGKRIYCKIEGKTCHQCRQKTLGHHTSCFHCESKAVSPHCLPDACGMYMHAMSKPQQASLTTVDSLGHVLSWMAESAAGHVQGQFCGDCIFMRYGENVLEVAKNPDWQCPKCRDICNCSFCRIRKGWAPTGALYPRARQEGEQLER